MIRGVIFDMDGVLADTEPSYMAVNRKFLESCGVDFTGLDYSEFIGMSATGMWTRIKTRYALPHSLEQLIANEREGFFAYISSISSLPTTPGIHELLQTLAEKQLKIGLASSSFRKNVDAVLAKTGLRHFFQEITSGEEIVNGKPAPDIFLLAADRLGLPPGQCCVVEDAYSGMCGALEAGMQCVGFQHPDATKQDLSRADLVVEDFSPSSRRRILTLLGHL